MKNRNWMCEHYKFETLILSGVCIGIFTVLIALGIWQLQRSVEKEESLDLLKSRLAQAPLRLNGEFQALDDLLYRRVTVRGVYDFGHQFVLDNQVFEGRVGAFVLTPLKIEGAQQAVLINRGWVPVVDREIVESDLAILKPRVSLAGIVNRFPGVGFKLEGGEIPRGGWPGWLQWIDPETLSSVLGYPVLPFQVLLDPDFHPGFVREWKINFPVSPVKHLAYAVQWFALAGLLVGMVLWRWKKA
ncbi:MAG: SURF1 family protein [Gammaproteobacteria bacterium]